MTVTKDTAGAITFSNRLKTSSVIGIDLTAQTGFNTSTKIKPVFSSAGQLWGSDGTWQNAARIVGTQRMASQRARSRQVGLLVLVLGAAVLAVGIAAIALSGGRVAGPLQPSSTTTVELPLAADEAGTWGVDLPLNPTPSDMIVKSVEPIDPQGLAILGMTMTNPRVAGGVVAVFGYPPPGLTTFPIEGSVLSPSGGTTPELEVLVGVQLAEGSKRGSIQGLRVRYAIDRREYEVVLPYSFSLVLPAS